MFFRQYLLALFIHEHSDQFRGELLVAPGGMLLFLVHIVFAFHFPTYLGSLP